MSLDQKKANFVTPSYFNIKFSKNSVIMWKCQYLWLKNYIKALYMIFNSQIRHIFSGPKLSTTFLMHKTTKFFTEMSLKTFFYNFQEGMLPQ